MAYDNPSTSHREDPYVERGKALLSLGFADYQAYLASQKWAEIKRRIVSGHECYVCGRRARVAHHISYSKEALDGKDDSQLFPLCNNCHHAIHDRGGEHVPANETQWRMNHMRANRKAHEKRLLDKFRKYVAAGGVSKAEKRRLKRRRRKYADARFKATGKLPTAFTAQSLIENSRLGGSMHAAWLDALARNP